MPKEDQEIKEQAVDIVIAAAENIKDRNQLNDDIAPQVIPVRIERTEYACIAVVVIRSKQICKVFNGVCKQQLIFVPGKIIGIPVIISGAINMYGDPANSNTGKYFNNKECQQNLWTDTGIFYKRHTQQQPT